MVEFNEQQREAAAIRADMQKVYKIITDAKNRYIKEKLRAKSKKQAEDAERLFADLDAYRSKQDIQDYFGYGSLSFAEYDRLINLWDMREQHAKDGKKYCDRVINMLDKAVAHIGDEYQDILYEYDKMARENDQLIRDKKWRGR